jgi:L-2,4-diaminobutyric acid acetyltransferase
MWELATQTVDANSRYKYLLFSEYFDETCVVAMDVDGDLVGFTTGFAVPGEPDTLFIWQIAVADTGRGRGVASAMLDDLVSRTRPTPFRFLEATVTPDNRASATLFERFAERRGAPVERDVLFDREDFGGQHDAEVRFRIGPF